MNNTNFLKDIEDFIDGDKEPKKKLKLIDYFPKLVDYYDTVYVPIFL